MYSIQLLIGSCSGAFLDFFRVNRDCRMLEGVISAGSTEILSGGQELSKSQELNG